MDDNMGEFKDIELITANEGWIQCEHPPIVRFDHEQMQWQRTAAKHHIQHQQEMDVLDAWAEAGFDEGRRPMDCDVQEWLDHPDSDIPFWLEWSDSVQAICSWEVTMNVDGFPQNAAVLWPPEHMIP